MIHARLVQAVVYFERHVVSFEYSVSLYNRNNRFYIRTKFSTRARKFWNFLPKEIKELNYPSFKKEAKLYVLANAEWFLNFGNRNGAGAKDLPKIKLFDPKKLEKKHPRCKNTGILNDKNLPKKIVKIKGRYS